MSKIASFQDFRPSVQRSLKGFSRTAEAPTRWARASLDRQDFPVPDLLLILLRDVMEFEWSGPGEKARWTVFFGVDNKAMAIELAKFGLKLYYEEDHSDMIPRVLGQLKSALGRLESRLKPLIDEQISAGNVTIANRLHNFQQRYLFFRDNADAAFRTAKRPARRKSSLATENSSPVSVFFEQLGRQLQKQTEAFFYSVAMVDAYFSYLEHKLVLLRAFLGNPLPEGGIEEILATRWDEKMRIVLGDEIHNYAPIIGKLREIKERIRNPFAHGGVENDRGSIYCHIPGVGAIPGNMSRTKRSAHFKWIPIDTVDHQSVCQLFDEVDEILRKGHLSKPSLMADGGVDPVWSKDGLTQYRKLMRKQNNAVQEYVNHWNIERDRHDNMDY